MLPGARAPAHGGGGAATARNLSGLQIASTEVEKLLTNAQLDYGPVRHGASVNQTLADYMRELDHADRGLRNARNALRALEAERRHKATAKAAE